MVFNPGWILKESDEPLARTRLDRIVAFLARQRLRQQFFEYGSAGLLWGMAIATVVVSAGKLAVPGMPVAVVAATIAAIALAVALAEAWIDRPDKLQVAILADIELKLKQRLSTAWEFAQRDEDPALAQYLAVQAVNQRYPTRHQPVFPLRATTTVRLLPVAALLLVLVSLVDLPQAPLRTAPSVDDVVVSEGARLREFARQMQARAEREGLPRSTTESDRIRRLGARMESGSISREQSLHRLQELGRGLSGQRRAAMADAGAFSADSFSAPDKGASEAGRLRDLLEQLLQGRVSPGELDLSAESDSLAALGIDSDALRQALDNFEAGKPQELREMVSELTLVEIALEDAGELGRASERIALVRENLGDDDVGSERFVRSRQGVEFEAGDDDPRLVDALIGRFERGHDSNMPADHGSGAGTGESDRQAAQSLRGSAGADVAMRPQSRAGEGSSFATQARVLPRATAPEVSTAHVDAGYAAQMEEAFAREHYPLHHKEFIRRYFLALSQGQTGKVPSEAGNQ